MSGEPWKLWVTDQPDGAGTTVLTLQFAAVERTTRFTMLLHLPRMTGHGKKARVKMVRRSPSPASTNSSATSWSSSRRRQAQT